MIFDELVHSGGHDFNESILGVLIFDESIQGVLIFDDFILGVMIFANSLGYARHVTHTQLLHLVGVDEYTSSYSAWILPSVV